MPSPAEPTGDTAAPEPEVRLTSDDAYIDLTRIPTYRSGKPYMTPLKVGQGVRFTAGVGQPHTLTVDTLSDNDATFTLRSTPQTHSLRVGETDAYDVTDDDRPDIAVSLVGVTDSTATFTFSKITTPVESPSPSNTAPAFPWSVVIASGIGAVIVVVLLIVVAMRHRR